MLSHHILIVAGVIGTVSGICALIFLINGWIPQSARRPGLSKEAKASLKANAGAEPPRFGPFSDANGSAQREFLQKLGYSFQSQPGTTDAWYPIRWMQEVADLQTEPPFDKTALLIAFNEIWQAFADLAMVHQTRPYVHEVLDLVELRRKPENREAQEQIWDSILKAQEPGRETTRQQLQRNRPGLRENINDEVLSIVNFIRGAMLPSAVM